MKHKSHFIAGIIISLLLIFLTPLFQIMKQQFTLIHWILLPIIIYFGSEFCDLDLWSSKIRRYSFTIVFSLLIGVGIYGLTKDIQPALIIAGIIGLLSVYSIHRGRMHTTRFGILLSLPLFIVNGMLGLIFLVCYMTHIVTDKFVSNSKKNANKFLTRHPNMLDTEKIRICWD